MERVSPEKLTVNAVDLWKNKWLLLTAGTMDDCNMMTVAWGSIGCMWNRPFAQVVVRPQRHYPGFNEASLILECRKMYRQPMNPEGFITDAGEKVYPEKDYHVIFFGEIVAAFKE